MKKLFSDIFTEKDGETICVGRFLWIWGAFLFFTLAAWAVFHGKEFDPQNYGVGLGGVLAGGGAGVALKGRNES